MSGSEIIPRAIGKVGEGRKVAAKVQASKLKDDSIVQQATGVTGDGNDVRNEGDQARSYFDMAPHAVQVDAGDEAMRDLVSLQPHFGANQLMGERPWDPAVLAYLDEKRSRAVQQKVDDLALAVHDPLNPIHRQRLEALIPGLARSKSDVFRAVQEQRAFIENCAIELQISAQDWNRLCRILGGGEKLLTHPLDKAFQEANYTRGDLFAADVQSLARQFRVIPGLFGFATMEMANRESPTGISIEDGRPGRVRIAAYCLHHFPRMLEGAYDTLNQEGTSPQEKRERGAEAVVRMCERIVAEMVPLGNVANRYVNADVIRGYYGEGAQQVGRDQFANAFTNGNAPAWPYM